MNIEGQDLSRLKKEKQATSRQIKETTKKLRDNRQETRRQINRLSSLRNDMRRQTAIIAEARHKADSVAGAIAALTDSIATLEADMKRLRDGYAVALRRLQSTSSPSGAMRFIFSSGSMEQMYRRVRYIKQFSNWRKRKADQIKTVRQRIADRRMALDTLNRERADMLQRADLAGRRLMSQETETRKLVSSLKQERTSLQAFLKEKEQQQRQLAGQIDRLIQQEQQRRTKLKKEQERKRRGQKQSKAEKIDNEKKNARQQPMQPDPDRVLTGDFENNRGKLLFPVASRYTIARDFGRQRHPDLPNVYTDNNGIDIETGNGTAARAIFRGTVSAIFKQPGFGTIIMVRHGRYISIYAGLSSCKVKNGQEVKTGQNLGTIMPDPDNAGHAVLHFEIRREREKLNPHNWVR